MLIPENMSEKGVRWSAIIEKGMNEGLSDNKIRIEMRKLGMGYDQKAMVRDFRQFRIQKEGFETVKRLPGFLTPPIDYIKKPNFTTVQERYAAVITGDFENLDTGKIETYTKTITFDSMMSKSDMVTELSWVMSDKPYPVELAFVSGEVDYIFKGLRK